MAKKMWSVRATENITKWNELLDLFNTHPEMREVCPSSDSNLQAIECWCAECRELRAYLAKKEWQNAFGN